MNQEEKWIERILGELEIMSTETQDFTVVELFNRRLALHVCAVWGENLEEIEESEWLYKY